MYYLLPGKDLYVGGGAEEFGQSRWDLNLWKYDSFENCWEICSKLPGNCKNEFWKKHQINLKFTLGKNIYYIFLRHSTLCIKILIPFPVVALKNVYTLSILSLIWEQLPPFCL